MHAFLINPLAAGGGLFDLQSTSEFAADQYGVFSLVAGKENFFIFDDFKNESGHYLRWEFSIDNGATWLAANYQWSCHVHTMGSHTHTSSGTGLNIQPSVSEGGYAQTSVRSGYFRVKSNAGDWPIFECLLVGIMTGMSYPQMFNIVGSVDNTSVITDVRISASANATGLTSGKIHHYTQEFG